MSKIYKLIPIYNLSKDIQLQVLKIRNSDYIRNWMLSNRIINIEEHFSWIESLKNDQSKIYFIIIDKNYIPIGSINLTRIDKINKSAELGLYKTTDHNEKGLMTHCLNNFINYSFCNLEIEKIYCNVIENNIKCINLLNRSLFIEEGYLRSHIICNGKRVSLHFFGLLKSDWINNKEKYEYISNIKIEINNV